jgi:periplasmic protein TonB
MFIAIKDLMILGAVITVHLLFFLLGLWHNPRPDQKEIDVLQAELISPPPPPAPPKNNTPPAPPPTKPPPKLLSVAPSQNKATSKPQEQVKERPQEKSEVTPTNKSEPTTSNESAKTPDPVANTSSAKSSATVGTDAGAVELNQLIMVYRPDTEVFYPRLSKDIGEQGIVGVQMFINESGEVKSVNVVRSSGFTRLDNAAMQLASRIRFRPYLVNGVPSKVNAGISIKFQLNR